MQPRLTPDPIMPRIDGTARQSAFATALLEPRSPAPGGLTTRAGADPARRFDVHRNNVAASLVAALAKRFPVCRRLVGEAFFDAMARIFVRSSPPRSPILAEYGAGFAAFVAAFQPAAELPYLPDVARLEFAVGSAYHATDALPMAIEALNNWPPRCWADLRFAVHPAVRTVPSRHPIVAIWRTNTFDRDVSSVDAGAAEDALVTRPQLQVDVRALRPGGSAFAEALSQGQSLAAADAAATAADARFELTAGLADLFASGAIAGILPAHAVDGRAPEA